MPAGVVRDGWNGFNMLHECASTVAALDLGFVPSAPSASPKFVYNLGADDYDEAAIPADAFVVYQGAPAPTRVTTPLQPTTPMMD